MPDLPLEKMPIAIFDYDVRADGKRTGAAETLLYQSSVTQINHFTWDYDELGRLVKESFTTNADELIAQNEWPLADETGTRPIRDYLDRYAFDLAGNRMLKTTDYDLLTTAVDEAITYLYDANDRLFTEWLDDNVSANDGDERRTEYGYDHTQLTSKTVYEDEIRRSESTSTYDLQGRLFTTDETDFAADGQTVTRIEHTNFDYGHTGIRVASRNRLESWDDDTSSLVLRRDLATKYLVDHHNFTGYQQVIREETTNVTSGDVVRTVVYTLGVDVISQSSSGPPILDVTQTSSGGPVIPHGSHLFQYDGHGSVRGIIPVGQTAAAPVVDGLPRPPLPEKSITFDAYGNSLGFTPLYAGTSILYSGEWFQIEIDQQYLRARYYDAATGRFDRKDPFFGRIEDPQSLHKYLYVHGDPTNRADPTGKFAGGLASVLVTAGAWGSRWGSEIAPKLAMRLVAENLGATVLGYGVGTVAYFLAGLPTERGSIYGAKLGFALHIGYRRKGDFLKEMLFEGIKSATMRSVNLGWDSLRRLSVAANNTAIGDAIIPDFMLLQHKEPFSWSVFGQHLFQLGFEGFVDGAYNKAIEIFPQPREMSPTVQGLVNFFSDQEVIEVLDAVITSITADLRRRPRPTKVEIATNAIIAAGPDLTDVFTNTFMQETDEEMVKLVRGIIVSFAVNAIIDVWELFSPEGKYL